MYASGVKSVKIQYCPGHLNSSADALSCAPQLSNVATSPDQDGPLVAAVTSTPTDTTDISALLEAEPIDAAAENFGDEQRKDPNLQEIFLLSSETGTSR